MLLKWKMLFFEKYRSIFIIKFQLTQHQTHRLESANMQAHCFKVASCSRYSSLHCCQQNWKGQLNQRLVHVLCYLPQKFIGSTLRILGSLEGRSGVFWTRSSGQTTGSFPTEWRTTGLLFLLLIRPQIQPMPINLVYSEIIFMAEHFCTHSSFKN